MRDDVIANMPSMVVHCHMAAFVCATCRMHVHVISTHN